MGGTGNLPVPSGYQPDGVCSLRASVLLALAFCNLSRLSTRQVAARNGLAARSIFCPVWP